MCFCFAAQGGRVEKLPKCALHAGAQPRFLGKGARVFHDETRRINVDTNCLLDTAVTVCGKLEGELQTGHNGDDHQQHSNALYDIPTVSV